MASRKKQTPKTDEPAPQGAVAGVSKYQKFTMERLHRRQMLNAPYNPRQIDDDAKKLLRQNLARVGLVGPVTWNRTTGNIVGGHQRLAGMDALEGGDDYLLDVAVVEMDDATEKEQNIFLNNPNAMGDWDLVALQKLLPDITAENTGFSEADFYQLFGDRAAEANEGIATALADQLNETRERYERVVAAGTKERDDTDFYAVVVFRNWKERDAFCRHLGADENKYVDGRKVAEKCGLELTAPGSPGPSAA